MIYKLPRPERPRFTHEIKNKVISHVEEILSAYTGRPAKETANALLSWKRARKFLSDLENTLGKVKGKKLLEIGSGYGLFLVLCLIKGVKAFGIEPAASRPYTLTLDVSRELLARAGFPRNSVKAASGENLPFGDSSFDLIVSYYTLEHVQEAARVLRPDGHIFFIVPNYGSFWEGHYGIIWLPHIPKVIAKYYVRLWGKDEKLLDQLQLVNCFTFKRIVRDLPFEIIDMGKTSFREKVLNLNSGSESTLGSAYKVAKFFKKIKVLNLLIFLANLVEAQTPITFVARKV